MTARPSAERIAACLVCRNEADKIVQALQSVAWCDEVVVMDLESTDGCPAVARKAGALVLSRSPVPIVELVRNDVAAAACSDWILVLDPDERVSPGLARELETLRARQDLDAVVVPRMNVDLGYPPSSALHRFEAQLRMYRRSRVRWPTFPNALPNVPEGRLHRVEPRDDLVLVHDRSRDIAEVVERILRYAPAQGQAMADDGQVFTAKGMLSALGRKAYREFVVGEPWRDGVPGLLRAGLIVTFHFYVWAAFWQASGVGRTAADDRVINRLGLVFRTAGFAARAAEFVSRRGAGPANRRGSG
jgi:glycosyltransferase involved in cell wall biosynthesis